jgi:hypothetical protein
VSKGHRHATVVMRERSGIVGSTGPHLVAHRVQDSGRYRGRSSDRKDPYDAAHRSDSLDTWLSTGGQSGWCMNHPVP